MNTLVVRLQIDNHFQCGVVNETHALTPFEIWLAIATTGKVNDIICSAIAESIAPVSKNDPLWQVGRTICSLHTHFQYGCWALKAFCQSFLFFNFASSTDLICRVELAWIGINQLVRCCSLSLIQSCAGCLCPPKMLGRTVLLRLSIYPFAFPTFLKYCEERAQLWHTRS